MSSKSEIITQYVASIDAGDLQKALTLTTDDCLFKFSTPEASLSQIGYADDGLGKTQYSDMFAKIREVYFDFKTDITKVVENGDKASVEGTTYCSRNVPAMNGKAAHRVDATTKFSAEYTFLGNKIAVVDAKTSA